MGFAALNPSYSLHFCRRPGQASVSEQPVGRISEA